MIFAQGKLRGQEEVSIAMTGREVLGFALIGN